MGREVNIIFNGDMQPEQKAEIESVIEEVKWLLPNWMLTLFVHVYSDIDSNARARINYQYRSGDLGISLEWFNQNRELRRQNVVHEFLHYHTLLFVDYARKIIGKFIPDEENATLNSLIMEEFEVRSESATEDLAEVIDRKLYRF